MDAAGDTARREARAGFGLFLRGARSGLGDIFMPPLCPACQGAVGAHDLLCLGCWAELRFIERPFCPVLGVPFAAEIGETIVSAEALADPPPFARARSAVLFDETARRLVHKMKYHDQPGAAGIVAALTLRAARELADAAEIVVPVPLHRWRLWQRRFNQSAEIAARLASEMGLRHLPAVLARTRHTRQQVGLSGREREANMRGAFRVPERWRPVIAGRHVLLVDDVYTSGATIKSAARALLRGGASAVDVVTFARAGIEPLG
ncbi:ComF family protein [Afifella pfennigii]|uniref:ComF family protein n=1 Tax=Afifella pfennigii TaxID=209897 RepID=UPI000ABDAA6F|nr:ComF family protein [Afifella pfennigii]